MAVGKPGSYEAKRHKRCAICDQVFGYYPSSRSNPHFCSYSCHREANRIMYAVMRAGKLRAVLSAADALDCV